ncbi:PWWP domain-containing protein [Mycena sanguinolenta]|uniref:PWWP domain-containing protein n=1 Tax=Mycena sanguinolenta TaxID=230812 RepID=A0A8H7D467_9AGAR|nr:PWWP domain-containing protein [Mycena sanguinolenta]
MSTAEAVEESRTSSESPVQDPDYHFTNGDTIVRVENTLFKIHKYRLIHNSRILEGMFGSPFLADDAPLVLHGEMAEKFRFVLKYIYAPPTEVQIDGIRISALREIIYFTKFAHKYEMDKWKDWGLLVLTRLLVDFNVVPVRYLSVLYLLYHHVGDYPARDRVMKRWRSVMAAGTHSTVAILEAADECNDKAALSEIYCVLIRRCKNGADIFHPRPLAQDGVGPLHLRRIISGCTSLSLSWNRLYGNNVPLPFQPPAAQCEAQYAPERHQQECIPHYRGQWTKAISEAERRYPCITQMSERLCAVGRNLLQNPGKACFDHFARQLDEHLRRESEYLFMKHFFPEPDDDDEENDSSRVDGDTDPEATQMREWRHKLQKAFLSQSQPVKAEEMPPADQLFAALEGYTDMTVRSLADSKIGKVMRHIQRLDAEKVPRDAEFHFRERAKALADKWEEMFAKQNMLAADHSVSAGDNLNETAEHERGCL